MMKKRSAQFRASIQSFPRLPQKAAHEPPLHAFHEQWVGPRGDRLTHQESYLRMRSFEFSQRFIESLTQTRQ